MKQTSEQYFNNLTEEPETYACSGFYCPPTPIPQGYYECPHCDGTGDTCKGKGYITLKELNKWNKKHPKTYCVSGC